MSSLIVSHDLHIMMLEFSVGKLFVPPTSVFERAILRKSVVMFRMLDNEWTSLLPHRRDHQPYHGSNYEEEPFYGGKSIVFSIPEASLEKPMEEEVDIQVHVRKEVSRYFEMEPCRNIGIARINVQDLFNGIIEDLDVRRKMLKCGARVHEREPISRSTKDSYALMDEDGKDSGALIEIYVRITYFGKSIITEVDVPDSVCKMFYVKEETSQKQPYQCRELELEEVERGCWGSRTFVNPVDPRNLKCVCDGAGGGKVEGAGGGKVAGAKDENKDEGGGGVKDGKTKGGGGEGSGDGGNGGRGTELDDEGKAPVKILKKAGEPEVERIQEKKKKKEKQKPEDRKPKGGDVEKPERPNKSQDTTVSNVTGDSEGGGDVEKKNGKDKEKDRRTTERGSKRKGGGTVGLSEKKKAPCPDISCNPIPYCCPPSPPCYVPCCQPFSQCVSPPSCFTNGATCRHHGLS